MISYTLTQIDGSSAVLPPGLAVLAQQQRLDTPQEAEAAGLPTGSYIDVQTQIGYFDLDGYSDDLLLRWKIVRTSTTDPIPPVAIPDEVPMYKVRKYLTYRNAQGDGDYLAMIQNFIDAMPQPARDLAQIDFDHSPNLVTASSLAMGAKAACGLTDADYQAMILAAAAFP